MCVVLQCELSVGQCVHTGGGRPSNGVAIPNIVWCMAYTKRGRGEGRILRSSRVIVFVLGELVNPHRERQTIPQSQTWSPPSQ